MPAPSPPRGQDPAPGQAINERLNHGGPRRPPLDFALHQRREKRNPEEEEDEEDEEEVRRKENPEKKQVSQFPLLLRPIGARPMEPAPPKTRPDAPASSSPSPAERNRTWVGPVPSSGPNPSPNSSQSWWESISRARSRIQSLSAVLGPSSAAELAAMADSDQPARALLASPAAYSAMAAALSLPSSGSSSDALCQWLYETLQSPDPDLRLVVLAFVPLLAGLYLSRAVAGYASGANSPSLAGFESVLLSVYAAEARSRGGKPLIIHVPDLSQPSLYHTTRPPPPPGQLPQSVAVLSPPLEPQTTVKSTKRAAIVAVALDGFARRIAAMPSAAKVEFCVFAAAWAGEFGSGDEDLDAVDPNWASGGRDLDGGDRIARLEIEERAGSRVPLPWELLQPVLRILGHCLLAPLNPPEVRDSAAVAVRRVHRRACHDLLPQAMLAARSLIQLDKRSRDAYRAAAPPTSSTNPNTPSKPRKPEMLLSSK
ncbi:uncharacterized protein LOC144711013 [Wolffia australiana]